MAAGLYNLKMHSPDFLTLTKQLGLSDTSRKRYLRIGNRISDVINTQMNGSLFISEDDLEWLTRSLIGKGEKLTLRGLDKASSDLSSFRSYLQGEIEEGELFTKQISSGEAVKSLPDSDERDTVVKAIISNTNTWDEIEKVILPLPDIVKVILRRKERTEPDEHEKFAKYRAMITTLEQLRLSVSAYHRGDHEAALALLSGSNELV